MTCRHAAGDPNCSSSPNYVSPYQEPPKTPDASNYEVEDVLQVGGHIVLKVKYPNCSRCAYEGNKVMVFLNTKPIDVLKWKKIDPHFRDPKSITSKKEAPSPAARFPASEEGWQDAVTFATGKATK